MKNLRKDQWLTIAIVGVVLLTFVLVFYMPQCRQLNELQDQRTKSEQQLQADRAKLAELTQLQAEVTRLSGQLEFYNRRLPDDQDVGQFVKDISNYAQLCGLEESSFQPQKPRAGEAVCATPIDMRFKGTFAELFRFLRQARNMPRLTHVETLNLRNNANLTGECGIDMMMNIYFTRG